CGGTCFGGGTGGSAGGIGRQGPRRDSVWIDRRRSGGDGWPAQSKIGFQDRRDEYRRCADGEDGHERRRSIDRGTRQARGGRARSTARTAAAPAPPHALVSKKNRCPGDAR